MVSSGTTAGQEGVAPVDALVVTLFRVRRDPARLAGAAVRRRPDRRRGPRPGGVHPAGPQRPPDPRRGAGGRLPALDRHQPRARPQPARAGVACGTGRRQHPDEPSAEETRPRAEARQEVVEALRALPRRQRDCVALRYYLELSIDDIAETLGVSANSVKTHLQRGLRSMAADPGGDAMSAPRGPSSRGRCTTRRDDRGQPIRPRPVHPRRRQHRRRPRVDAGAAPASSLPGWPAWPLATIAVLTLTPRNDEGVTAHALVDPRARDHRRPRRHRAVARAVHQAVRPRLRRRRLPRQPADRARATSCSPTSSTT